MTNTAREQQPPSAPDKPPQGPPTSGTGGPGREINDPPPKR